MDAFGGVALRGLCALYFENHVSPLLRSLQDSQDQLRSQLSDIRTDMCKKADADAVPTLDYLETRLQQDGRPREGESTGVSVLVKLQELNAKKADANDVPTMSHLKKVLATLEQKAILREAALTEQVGNLAAKLHKQQDVEGTCSAAQGIARIDVSERATPVNHGTPASKRSVVSALGDTSVDITDQTASVASSPTMARMEALEKAVAEVTSMGKPDEASSGGTAGETNSDIRKVQIVVAAAGARLERQIREVKLQVAQLRRDVPGQSRAQTSVPPSPREFVNRWPGRVIGDGPPSELGSVACESENGSAVASACGSVSGLTVEERAEFKKIQAVVGAAGTMFTRDLREVRGNIKDLWVEVKRLNKQPAPF